MTRALTPDYETRTTAAEARRVTAAGSIGFFVENYDNSVYGFLAGIVAIVFFPEGAEQLALLFTLGIFAVSFFFRPVGGVVIGIVADRFGRRPAMVFALTLMAGATTVVGLLPGYASWGVWSVIILLLMRMIQGVSVGGEVSAAFSFVGEHAPPRRRAFFMSFASAASTLANLAGTGFAFLLTSALPAAAMESWGWRIPFLLAAPLGIIGFYIRRRLEDTPAFAELKAEGKVARNPLRDAFSRGNRRRLALAFVLPLLNSAGFFVLFVYMPTYMTSQLSYERSDGLIVSVVALAVCTIAIPFAGLVADRVGRRPVMLSSCALVVLLAVPTYLLVGTGTVQLAVLGGALLAFVFAGNYATIHPLMIEMFPTHMRTTAYSLGYNVTTAVFGGAAPLILSALYLSTGNLLLPGFFIGLAAVGTGIAALVKKETVGRSLTQFV